MVDDCVMSCNFRGRNFVGVAAWIELARQLIDALRGHDWRRQHASACKGGPGAQQYFISPKSSLPFRFTSSVARHAMTLNPKNCTYIKLYTCLCGLYSSTDNSSPRR